MKPPNHKRYQNAMRLLALKTSEDAELVAAWLKKRKPTKRKGKH